LPDSKFTPVESARGQILAQCSGEERISAFDEFVDAFESNDENSLIRPTVDLRMSVGIAFKTEGAD